MAKAVLTTRQNSQYDDLPEVRYHFPRRYIRPLDAAVGDLVVYYEPRRGTESGYFATAVIERIEQDSRLDDHFYAFVQPGSFVQFTTRIPFRERSGEYYESILRKSDGSTSKGAFRSVRSIPEDEFATIVRAGHSRTLALNPWERMPVHGFSETQLLLEDTERPIVEQLTQRPFRDRAFQTVVREAYSHTCALTGLSIRNGGGRPEVEAAHIRPVHAAGPDSPRNGLALSGTAHWMFDRGLVSLTDRGRILVSDAVPDSARRLFRPDGEALLPRDPALRPAPSFLDFHRTTIFKG